MAIGSSVTWRANSSDRPTEEASLNVEFSMIYKDAAWQRQSRRALSITVPRTASGSEVDRPSSLSTSLVALNCSMASA
jgi:hypothetical protein